MNIKWKNHFRKNACFLRAAGTAAMFILSLLLIRSAVSAYYGAPCRVEADCRLKNVTVEDMKLLEEQEKDGMAGLSALAAWRYGKAGKAADPASLRSKETGVVYACGTVSLAFPAKVLCGSYGQAMGAGDCVLTKELSYALYGSTDTGGCLLTFDRKTYRVAAVIDKEEELLILPALEGRVEHAAFLFRDRERVKERMEALGF